MFIVQAKRLVKPTLLFYKLQFVFRRFRVFACCCIVFPSGLDASVHKQLAYVYDDWAHKKALIENNSTVSTGTASTVSTSRIVLTNQF